ncbi:hypothetical protein SBRCBS47491_003000 [Sporothrix bragantina]|uniref:RNA polymerase I-specific transcription initiation factor RRN6-like protein n=1 Tax=Sporothrix bragantina TaxID=671064 RepID=A0ABP0BCH5_9PEZI
MAERRRPGQPASSKPLVVGLVRDHRVNDLVYGHVGRLAYVSIEDLKDINDKDNRNENENDSDHEPDDGDNDSHMAIGPLLTNRIAGSVYTFQEVARFQEWYLPTARDISGIRTVAPQYLNRLLAEAPESLSGVAGPLYPGFIEAAQESEQLKSPQTRLPLLSYGEITDMSSREPVGRMAVAMATGQSGHALRIVQVQREHWGWHQDGNATLKLSNIDPEDEGHWCDNALSINQIKFTSSGNDGDKSSAKKASRWILVQTAAETIVFQPTLHGVPVQGNKVCACDHAVRGPNYLAAGPIIRIPSKETGGRAHCDVAFNPATDAKPPQLAIIDEAGQWSVWNVVGSTHARKNILLPFLHVRGTFTDGITPGPSMPAMQTMHGLGHLHRVAWLPKATALPGESTQSNTLLLGSATAVNVTSLDKKDSPLRVFNATHNVGLDNIVDVQVSPNNASHVFVLTTTTIFWLDLSSLNTVISPGKYSKTKKPLLLLSCPHLRSPIDKTMKLSLARSTSHLGENVTLALIYSMRHPEVAVFWFPEVTTGSEPTYQQQVFQLARPQFDSVDTKTKTRMLGQQAMLLLSKDVVISQSNARLKDTFGHQYARPGVNIFQIITLGADMSLWSSLCASASGPQPVRLAPFPPVPKRKHSQKNQGTINKKRRVGAKYFRKSFVVPDEFEEYMLHSGPRMGFMDPSEQAAKSLTKGGSNQPFEVYNMARLYNLLDKHLDKAAELAYETTDVVRGFQNPSPLDMIRQILDIAAEHGSFAYTTLLNISNSEYLEEYGADLTDFSWTRQLADIDIGQIEDVRVCISNQMKESKSRNGGAETLYEAMSKLCLIPRVGDGQRYSHETVRRQGLLAFAAVQLYFSQISMVVMPRQVAFGAGAGGGTALTSARTTPGLEDGGLSAASTPYSAHFPRLDSESRFRHILSSSPAPSQQSQSLSQSRNGVPSWLPSSSQDDGLDSDGILPSLEDEGENTVLPDTEQQEQQEEDPVVARLRQYAKSIRSEPPRKDGELRLLSHWPLGSDPEQFHWVPMGAAGEAEEELRRQAQDARDRKRKKMEKRAMRDRERLLMLSGAISGGGGTGSNMGLPSSPVVPRIQPSSQVAPLSSQALPGMNHHYQNQNHRSHKSQPAAMASPRPMASQVFSSQVMASSQPMIRTGGPMSSQRPKKKKPKVARGFK